MSPRSAALRLVRGLSFGLAGGVGVGSLFFIHKNDYDVSHIGLVRFARAGITAGRIIADYKWNLLGLHPSDPTYNAAMKQAHQRGADRLLALAKANGGVFIKVGQHIAALQYLLPDEYTSTLAVLHSRAPESDFEDIKRVFRLSVGKELTEVFSYFNEHPCGVASLAQVHEAVLACNGKKVAVKIQHPRVKSRSVVDVAAMDLFVRFASNVFPDFKLMWLVDEVKRNLPRELDFLHEAHNAERVRRMFSHLSYLRVPDVHYDFCSDRVLTMSFEEGGQVNDIEYYRREGIDPSDICHKIGRLYSEMIFVNGYVHCDPHPGNVLVRKPPGSSSAEIVLLDHGLYSTLADDFRIDYCNLWNALLKPDKEEIKRVCTKMNVGELYNLFACIVTSRSWKSVVEGVDRTSATAQERVEIQEFAASLIPQISQVLDRMPRSMLLILKTNDLLRAIERSLGVAKRKGAFLEMARCCAWACYEHNVRTVASWREHTSLALGLAFALIKITLASWIFTIRSLFDKEKPSYEQIL